MILALNDIMQIYVGYSLNIITFFEGKTMPKSQKKDQNIDRVAVVIVPPVQIISWSYREVKKPTTINYQTFDPERNELFCAKCIDQYTNTLKL